MSAQYTERFTSYAAAHGCTPDVMAALWKVRGSGRSSADFMAWCSLRMRSWKALTKRKPDDFLSAADHIAYDAWLAGHVSPQPEARRIARGAQLSLFAGAP